MWWSGRGGGVAFFGGYSSLVFYNRNCLEKGISEKGKENLEKALEGHGFP